MNDKNNIAKTYEPAEFETRLYDFWTKEGFFHADESSEKEPFTIVIPPPNVTASSIWGMRSTRPYRIF